MPGRRMYGNLPTLPPQEYWLDSTLKKNSIPTPLDERGFVDMDEMVDVATSYIDPSYDWASPMNDVHHLHWSISTEIPKDISERDLVTLKQFRENVNRKMFTGRVPHNWFHWLYMPPPIPAVEAMQNSIDAQRVAISLAKTASLATRLTRISAIKQRDLDKRLEEEFINYNLFMENARLVPKEFSLLELERLEVEKPEDLLSVNKYLGRLALGAIPVRVRSLRREHAPDVLSDKTSLIGQKVA